MNCAYFKMLVCALMFSVGLAGYVFAGTNSMAQPSSVVLTNSAHKATASDLKTRLEYQLSVGVDKTYVYAGTPKGSFPLTLLTNSSYLVGYDEDLKAPRWVAYRLFKIGDVWERITAPSRDGFSFQRDERTKARVVDADLDGIGRGVSGGTNAFDRGHMAPNASIADCYGTNGQRETFLLSNVTIQRHTLNGETWAYLEGDEEDGVADYYTNAWVIDGPIFDKTPGRFGKASIAVPSAFFKILLVETRGAPQVESVIMSQQIEGPLEQNQNVFTTVHQIETKTGLTFFPALKSATRKTLAKEDAQFNLPPKPAEKHN